MNKEEGIQYGVRAWASPPPPRSDDRREGGPNGSGVARSRNSVRSTEMRRRLEVLDPLRPRRIRIQQTAPGRGESFLRGAQMAPDLGVIIESTEMCRGMRKNREQANPTDQRRRHDDGDRGVAT